MPCWGNSDPQNVKSALRLAHKLSPQIHVSERLGLVPKLMQVYFRTEFTHLNYVSFHTQFKFITVTLLWVVPSAFPGAGLAAGKAGALCPKQLCLPRR